MNKVFLMGRLGQDPKVHNNRGKAAKFSMATENKWTDKHGEVHKRVEWHNVVIFGKAADVAEKYLSQGTRVLIEGELRTNKWEDRDGNTHKSTEVHVTGFGTRLHLMDSKKDQQREPQEHEQAPDLDDEIPF